MESEEEDDGLPRFEDAYTLDPNDVQFVSEIGKGSFGVVYKVFKTCKVMKTNRPFLL